MADTKVTDLTAVTSLVGTELVPVVQSGVTKKAMVSDFRAGSTGAGEIVGSFLLMGA